MNKKAYAVECLKVWLDTEIAVLLFKLPFIQISVPSRKIKLLNTL